MSVVTLVLPGLILAASSLAQDAGTHTRSMSDRASVEDIHEGDLLVFRSSVALELDRGDGSRETRRTLSQPEFPSSLWSEGPSNGIDQVECTIIADGTDLTAVPAGSYRMTGSYVYGYEDQGSRYAFDFESASGALSINVQVSGGVACHSGSCFQVAPSVSDLRRCFDWDPYILVR